jgi:putative transposase
MHGMTRPLRVEVPGGTYHVTARGNSKLPIYADDSDRRAFLYTADQAISRFGWQCLAYCLMANHYHLVVTTVVPNLARGMRHLNGVYAQRFNRRHERGGHLFERRYGAVLVERDSHMLEVLRYVARNPVRAGLRDRPEQWWWSSHRAVLGLEPGGFVAARAVLALFADEPSIARRRYAAFVDDASADIPASAHEPIAGSQRFLEAHLPARRPSPEIPRRHWHPRRPSLHEIFETLDRDHAIAVAYREHGYRMREIAEALGCHYATVSRRLHAWEARQMS